MNALPRDPSSARAVVWTLAGSDSAGGAGIQADLKAFEAFGVHGCSALAALTAQNSLAVLQLMPVSAQQLDAQLAALAEDLPPRAIKTGLLASVENIELVCRWIDRLRARAQGQGRTVALVVDPVLGASTGASFATPAVIAAYRQQLLPRASLITPNRAEAARLLQRPALADDAAVEDAAQHLRAFGCEAVAITGGDAAGDGATGAGSFARDYIATRHAQGWLSLPRIDTAHHHGTGCVFAASAAAAMALGHVAADALILAKMATAQALRHGYAAGRGAGPVCPQPDFAQHLANLPTLQASGAGGAAAAGFAPLADPALGVYAVVDSAAWVQRVLDAGVRTVQLRIKNPQEPTLEAQIVAAIALARRCAGAQLFINDHWALALRHGAYGVHIGQEDLPQVDLARLRAAGLRLGISTHCYWEVARAQAVSPSYMACGPIFPTQAKAMPWIPQGLDNLRYWARLLERPVVGIAGIAAGNMQEVAAQGVSGAAVISAITGAADPGQACKTLNALFAQGHAQPVRTALPRFARATLQEAGSATASGGMLVSASSDTG